jgi:hypothetical protein
LRVISELDISRAANLLIGKHGADAELAGSDARPRPIEALEALPDGDLN